MKQQLKGYRGYSNLFTSILRSKKCEKKQYPFSLLEFFPNNFETQEMRKNVVKKCPGSLMYAPNCYVKLQKMWYENYWFFEATQLWAYDDLVEWHSSNGKRKTWKEEIMEEGDIQIEYQIVVAAIVCVYSKSLR